MPFRKTNFTIEVDDLQQAVDVDDSAGRSVPVNMNFVEEGYLTKDTGSVFIGQSSSNRVYSLFYYKKKNGTGWLIRGGGTKLSYYSFPNRTWYEIPGSPTFTAGAEFGFEVYNDELWGGNGVEAYFKFDGTTFTSYDSAPKGNILEIFEDRMFVSGVTAEPLSIYYSDVAAPQTFQPASVVKPLGTDWVTSLNNFYGSLLIFKQNTIWKLTFQFDQVLTDFIPKLEIQTGGYGACSRRAVVAVENDLWFFTGKEVRSIGFQDNVTGNFGINTSVISEQIKETLNRINPDYYGECTVYYNDRRFYLGVPLDGETVDTLFVCHLLYSRKWTKYTDRDKALSNDFAVVDSVMYSSITGITNGVIKWTVEAEDAASGTYYIALG